MSVVALYQSFIQTIEMCYIRIKINGVCYVSLKPITIYLVLPY